MDSYLSHLKHPLESQVKKTFAHLLLKPWAHPQLYWVMIVKQKVYTLKMQGLLSAYKNKFAHH